MNVLLIDIDSKIPNLALAKIEKYHKDKGDTVYWNLPIMMYVCEKIYVSCIFAWNKELCNEFEIDEWKDKILIGGTGYDIWEELPKEIEEVKPKINLGFTTRGCVRDCEFCVVPRKEGKIYPVGDIYDLWDGKSKTIELLDNNILGLPEHFKLIWSQIRKEDLILTENGLDIRLLTEENAIILKSIRHEKYHFAFDQMKDEKWVVKGSEILRRNQMSFQNFYVLVGFNTSFKEDIYRLELLKKERMNAYVMRYMYNKNDRKYIPLARWANERRFFHSMDWKQFMDTEMMKEYKKEFGYWGGEE